MEKLCLFFIVFIAFQSCQSDTNITLNLDKQPTELEIFGEQVISTSLYERDLAISPNGDEIIYTLGDYKQTVRSLVFLKKENNTWSIPEILPFSGKYQDIEPFFSDDGKLLFFASDRPMDEDASRKDYNIWVVEKTDNGWSIPEPLDTSINTRGDEFYPSVAKNGNLYYTATRRDGIGREDIFMSEKTATGYAKSIPLDTNINTTTYEFNAFIHPNEDLIIFSSYGRADDLGGGDLYFSKKNEDGKWERSQHLGEKINSTKLDYCPFIDVENGVFYFTSDRMQEGYDAFSTVDDLKGYANHIQNGMGNIYRISCKELNLE